MLCCLSSHAVIVAPGLVRSAENADLADTSGFDRFAALGIMLSALIAFVGWWTKPSPPRGREPRETQKVPPSGSCYCPAASPFTLTIVLTMRPRR
jgi:hypothetical protein